MIETKLPENTEEVAAYAEFSSYYLTLQRDEDSIVYLVSWAWRRPTVLAVIRPGGSVEALEDR